MNRRIIAMLLTITLVVLLVGCSGANKTNEYVAPNSVEKSENTSNNDLPTAEATVNVAESELVEFGHLVNYWNSEKSNIDYGPIEWRVLEKKGTKLLLLSRYGIDHVCYNDDPNSLYYTPWENCKIRRWLNSTFYEESFTPEEQKDIQTTHLINRDGEKLESETDDKIFLLSIDDYNTYQKTTLKFFTECTPSIPLTEELNDVSPTMHEGWWLRSPRNTVNIAEITAEGYLSEKGSVAMWPFGVRPALWVDEKAVELIYRYQVDGEEMSFGTYEQDNNLSNGKEAIEWLVLGKENNQVLLISKYTLDCQPYNSVLEDVEWEDCTLRKWLNESFYNNAFNENEQDRIQALSPYEDKVFLLDEKEIAKYFFSRQFLCSTPTEYAVSQGVRTFDKNEVIRCNWWLSSKGERECSAQIAEWDGYIISSNFNTGNYRNVDINNCGVRPAIWITI